MYLIEALTIDDDIKKRAVQTSFGTPLKQTNPHPGPSVRERKCPSGLPNILTRTHHAIPLPAMAPSGTGAQRF
jgi:hypothetical protein